MRMRIPRMTLSHTIGAAFLVFAAPIALLAQTPCGSIYGVDIFNEPFSNPIEDCAAPFGYEERNPDLSMLADGVAIVSGQTYPWAGQTVSLSYQGTTGNSVRIEAYRHDGVDYEQVFQSQFRPPYALTFPVAGTYTLVLTEEFLSFSEKDDIPRWFRWFVPIAHAYIAPPNLILTITVTEPVTGASSVLFLPGIMGSRLYEESDVCNSAFGEQERWLSRDVCDQERLATSIIGDSLYPLYTKVDAVIDETYGLNLYKSFISALDDWVDSDFIADYALVPYDWRLGLNGTLQSHINNDGRIVRDISIEYIDSYLYQTFSHLVSGSKSGKVTIVTHSNGGLLAKYFLQTLENNNDPLADKVDAIIMIAAPQTGTPDALVGLLHGTEINFVMSQQTTRKLLNTMPFIYHLMPHQSYFSGPGSSVDTPVISFQNGTATSAWISQYGSEIDSWEEMKSFVSKESGRVKPAHDDLLNPAVVDGNQFVYKDAVETVLSNWEPGPETVLYQIGGVGVLTPSSITYFTDRSCTARNPLRLFECVSYSPKLGYRVDMTIDGDGTVVVPSGLAISDSDRVHRKWVDLKSFNNDTLFNRVHKDILEIDEVIQFIQDVINNDVKESYQYLSDTPPSSLGSNRLAFTLHSPLEMTVESADGKRLSSTTETIPDGIYRRYGEIQYVSLPADGLDFTLRLVGKSLGSFTLETETLNGDVVTQRNSYSGIPSATGTQVTLEYRQGAELASLALRVDYNNDGVADADYDTNGIVNVEITYADLYLAINNLKVRNNLKTPLLILAKSAETFSLKSSINIKFLHLERAALQLLKNNIALYLKRKLISSQEKILLDKIILKLIK